MSHEEQLIGRLKATVDRMIKEDPDLSVISICFTMLVMRIIAPYSTTLATLLASGFVVLFQPTWSRRG